MCHNVSYMYITDQYDVKCHNVSYIVIAYTEQYGSHLQAIVWICTVFKALDMEIPCE